jgi:CcmD family protein
MEDLLKDILQEVRNLSYLFFAFGAIWTLLFLYLYSLSRREHDLQREVDEMKKMRAGEPVDEDNE